VKRILFLIPSVCGVGGTERMVNSLCELLADEEHDVLQASFDAPGVQPHFASARSLFPLGPIRRLPLPLRPLAYAQAALRLRRLKKRLHVDVTISNLWGADLISVLSGGADKKIALCHITVVGNPANRLMVTFRAFVSAIYRRFDRVVAVSEGLAHELRALYRLSDFRITHIDNFADRPNVDTVLPQDRVVRFVWCGRLSPEKNVEGLLHAWANFVSDREGVQLSLVGDGPLQGQLTSLTSKLNLRTGTGPEDETAQVVFVGRVTNPGSFMLGARCLLLSSYAEGLPMVILEALSLALPVLAADCEAGGVRAALQGSGRCDPARPEPQLTEAGALLPVPRAAEPRTLSAWVDVLRRACDDEGLSLRWRAGALGRAAHFSGAAVRAKWLKILECD
jgi:glycosyltransferase involved in cell wall biosynthesis